MSLRSVRTCSCRVLALWMALAGVAALAQATPPGRINYQGVVRDSAGTPLDGPVTMTFRFYDGPTAGNLLWEEIYDLVVYPPQVTVSGGLFAVALGDSAHRNAGSEMVFATVFANHADVYLAVRVAADAEMTPRVKAVSAPFAVNSAKLEGRAASTFANVAHTHSGGDVTSAVARATDADTLDGQHGSYFLNTSSAAQTKTGKLALTNTTPNDYAIDATGSWAGGYFKAGTGYAYVGYGSEGIRAVGSFCGGYFNGTSSGHCFAGYGEIGVDGHGDTAGGQFWDSDSSGFVYVGYGDLGIEAHGSVGGGQFYDSNGSGEALIANGDLGLSAWGNYAGGSFDDTNTSSWAYASYDTYKVYGSGTPAFVQNHPLSKDRVIVYACPEGDEVATYTRGTAKLANGEAHVKLGETFQWVTNPDLGLTAHLTPVGDWSDLYVAQKSTTELVVRSKSGAQDTTFDYIVYGLRIGFEESSVVQEKQRESYIPSFSDHRERYAKFPELRAYNALERFKAMESSVRGVAPEALDLSRARALKDAVHEYDPATDPPVEKLFGFESSARPEEPVKPPTPGGVSSRPALPAAAANPQAHQAALGTASAESERTAPAAATPTPAGAERLPVSRSVSAGDVLVMIANDGLALHPCAKAADPMVVGIALQDPQDGTAPVATFGSASVRADASQAPIARGDLLVTSALPGYAMRAPRPAEQGTVVGKALEPLESGTGVIKVLVMIR